MQTARAEDPSDTAAIRRAVEQSLVLEKELLVDPEYFSALTHHLPDLAGTDIQLKRGTAHNELTRYRYRRHPLQDRHHPHPLDDALTRPWTRGPGCPRRSPGQRAARPAARHRRAPRTHRGRPRRTARARLRDGTGRPGHGRRRSGGLAPPGREVRLPDGDQLERARPGRPRPHVRQARTDRPGRARRCLRAHRRGRPRHAALLLDHQSGHRPEHRRPARGRTGAPAPSAA
ncbi:hypothetical protein LV779_36080 [Streptomyces thinghirensis]|nr:hypothetical protein [Streptomyces thinghirensis]